MATSGRGQIYVLAGVNGAGKSSIAGAAFRAQGADYYNPDEVARALRRAQPSLGQTEANALAWQQGRRLLEQAVITRGSFAFESTLGGDTLTNMLIAAAKQGHAVHVWYAGLASAEQHIQRVAQRVQRGGHEIADADIQRRFETSRLNLVRLLPHLAALRVYDNSADADPALGQAPKPTLVLHMVGGQIVGPARWSRTPGWAKAIVAAALGAVRR